jgi:hypothetical protein
LSEDLNQICSGRSLDMNSNSKELKAVTLKL